MARFLRPNIRSFVSSQLRMSSDQVKNIQEKPMCLNVFLKNNYRKYSVLCTKECLTVVTLTWWYVEAMLFLVCSHKVWYNFLRAFLILHLCLAFIYYIILSLTLSNTQASFWSKRNKPWPSQRGCFYGQLSHLHTKDLHFLNDYTKYLSFNCSPKWMLAGGVGERCWKRWRWRRVHQRGRWSHGEEAGRWGGDVLQVSLPLHQRSSALACHDLAFHS